MLAALPNSNIGILPGLASTGRRKATAYDDPFSSDLATLRRDLSTLSKACADAIGKTAQHYHGEDTWVIGPMPAYGSLADSIEATARGFLANSHLSTSQTETVANTLKMTGDLRTAARGGRQAVQLAFLFQQQSTEGQEALELLATMADAVVRVAEQTALAIHNDDPNAAHVAAQAFRQVDSLRAQIEMGLRSEEWKAYFTPVLQKMIRAAVWNFAVAGEGMARVSARLLLPGG